MRLERTYEFFKFGFLLFQSNVRMENVSVDYFPHSRVLISMNTMGGYNLAWHDRVRMKFNTYVH